MRQSIPRGCCCWLERPFTDGGANCLWHHQVRRQSRTKSLASMYVGNALQTGAEPWRHRYVSSASRNVIRSATRNQCRLWSSGVMWSLRRSTNTRRAAAFRYLANHLTHYHSTLVVVWQNYIPEYTNLKRNCSHVFSFARKAGLPSYTNTGKGCKTLQGIMTQPSFCFVLPWSDAVLNMICHQHTDFLQSPLHQPGSGMQ